MKNFCSFPVRLGSADAEPLPVAGKLVVTSGPAAPGVLVEGVLCTPESAPIAVEGLPEDDGEAIVVAAPVAAAMAALGIRRRGAVISPGRVVDGYAPSPTLHTEVSFAE